MGARGGAIKALGTLTEVMPIEQVLVAHGDSVFEHGGNRIGEALRDREA